MSRRVLLLNADYSPIKVIGWKRALVLLMDERVYAVDYYDEYVRSMYLTLQVPSVVALPKYVRTRKNVRVSRKAVLARDKFTCGYCGQVPVTDNGFPFTEQLTVDHVVPRAQAVNKKVRVQGGSVVHVNHWLNVICACAACNLYKRDRTPKQAGMSLLWKPSIPTGWEVFRANLTRSTIPKHWEPYL